MEVILGVPFSYSINGEVRRLLEDFRDMINFCIDYAYRRKITSYARLRKGVYEEWKKRWDYSTHFCHSACKIALAMLKNHRRRSREGKPEARKLFMQLDPQLYKFYGDSIRISVKPRRFLYIDLKYGEYQRKFIDAWREGKLKTGEVTINEAKIIIPFKKDVDLTNPKDWIAIDVNESNVTAVSSNPHILKIESNLRTTHTTYFNIIRSIQKLSKFKPKTAERLLKKYSGRRKHKAADECHKISKKIVSFASEHKMGVVMEDLKGIRKRIDYGRRLNRRLHSWNFRKLQFYIEYKARLNGLPVIYVNPKGTSSLCPVCGGKLAPNGHRLVSCECGYEDDRDVIACLNMLRMRGAPLPPKALHEPLTVEVRGRDESL
ncbi:MAG: transposase [Candidatus Terraquivivens tikiterensis]|uniref:Transposase n=1 Tax=Candidatus Terraquivivens tikiterensis TaxID=1980982 RepID=A0A2R7Y2D6_9ARCH|nr:MAG: transposase [Candidatus Terraquivivens tikiterensis]